MLRSLGKQGLAAATLLAMAPQVPAAQAAPQPQPQGPSFAQVSTAPIARPRPVMMERPFDVRTYRPAAIGPFCPKALLAGDREFGGNGPEMWVRASVAVTADEALELTVSLRARETAHDWSETSGTWTRRLTPPEMKVKRILSGTRSEAYWVDDVPAPVETLASLRDWHYSPVAPETGTLVRTFDLRGDTPGGDISEDDNCSNDTAVRLIFNEMQLEVYR